MVAPEHPRRILRVRAGKADALKWARAGGVGLLLEPAPQWTSVASTAIRPEGSDANVRGGRQHGTLRIERLPRDRRVGRGWWGSGGPARQASGAAPWPDYRDRNLSPGLPQPQRPAANGGRETNQGRSPRVGESLQGRRRSR